MKKVILSLTFLLLASVPVFAENTVQDTSPEISIEATSEEQSSYDEEIYEEMYEKAILTEEENTGGTNREIHGCENTISRADIYVFNNGISLSKFPLIENDILLVPIAELLSHLGANDFSVDCENQITVTYGKNILAMYLDSDGAFSNGEFITLSHCPFISGECIYAPAKDVLTALGFTAKQLIDGNVMFFYADLPENETYSEKYVNSSRLESDTPYLIWVNKSRYTVYLFLGSKENWREIFSCKCSVGTPSTPTITGTFKYFSRESKWFFPDFYVGPVMRFYKGYAIHSTLLKYNGTSYNNAVGVKNSHGCVRIRPDDLNRIIDYAPLGTTVHLTEN